jgi:hypothetical protein
LASDVLMLKTSTDVATTASLTLSVLKFPSKVLLPIAALLSLVARSVVVDYGSIHNFECSEVTVLGFVTYTRSC